MNIYTGYRAGGSARVLKNTTPLDPAKSLRMRRHASRFDWGENSGEAAQLALAILLEETDAIEADKAYQAYKREVVSKLDREAWSLTSTLVRQWLDQWRTGGEAPTRDMPKK